MQCLVEEEESENMPYLFTENLPKVVDGIS